ncbi:Bidirectional sugar transporter SWEET16 [Symbiodinium microadriaticum]|uniref:Bidirectional sugar transporter SWEET16 n=1 Tax=Symbiodinium microadriaticum TaxID=2951 RepID=A0A1Q9ERB5_SYMMI|nr:Bidirectional sugar transporter SWEET16 [Symbiodinium microadriaticum]
MLEVFSLYVEHAAVATSVCFLLSPLVEVQKVHRSQGEALRDVCPSNLLLMLVNSALWLWYAICVPLPPLVLNNTIGLTACCYCLTSCWFYARQRREQTWGTAAAASTVLAFMAIFLALVYAETSSSHAQQVGYLAMAVNILAYGAPLAAARRVLVEKCSRALPPAQCVLALSSSFLWLCVGLKKQSMPMIVPNACGVPLAIVQLLLICFYPRNQRAGKDWQLTEFDPTLELEYSLSSVQKVHRSQGKALRDVCPSNLLLMLVNSALWLWYAIFVPLPPMVVSNTIGLTGGCYCLTSCWFYARQCREQTWGTAAAASTVLAFMAIFLALVYAATSFSHVQQLGYLAMAVNILAYGAPLAVVSRVLVEKCSRALPPAQCILALSCSFLWLCVGLTAQSMPLAVLARATGGADTSILRKGWEMALMFQPIWHDIWEEDEEEDEEQHVVMPTATATTYSDPSHGQAKKRSPRGKARYPPAETGHFDGSMGENLDGTIGGCLVDPLAVQDPAASEAALLQVSPGKVARLFAAGADKNTGDVEKLMKVMERCNGGDLFDLIASHADKGGLTETCSARVQVHLLSALAFLHDIPVVHRDVKCCSVLLLHRIIIATVLVPRRIIILVVCSVTVTMVAVVTIVTIMASLTEEREAWALGRGNATVSIVSHCTQVDKEAAEAELKKKEEAVQARREEERARKEEEARKARLWEGAGMNHSSAFLRMETIFAEEIRLMGKRPPGSKRKKKESDSGESEEEESSEEEVKKKTRKPKPPSDESRSRSRDDSRDESRGRNHTGHNQIYKDLLMSDGRASCWLAPQEPSQIRVAQNHRNGIKKTRRPRKMSMRGMNCRFVRNQVSEWISEEAYMLNLNVRGSAYQEKEIAELYAGIEKELTLQDNQSYAPRRLLREAEQPVIIKGRMAEERVLEQGAVSVTVSLGSLYPAEGGFPKRRVKVDLKDPEGREGYALSQKPGWRRTQFPFFRLEGRGWFTFPPGTTGAKQRGHPFLGSLNWTRVVLPSLLPEERPISFVQHPGWQNWLENKDVHQLIKGCSAAAPSDPDACLRAGTLAFLTAGFRVEELAVLLVEQEDNLTLASGWIFLAQSLYNTGHLKGGDKDMADAFLTRVGRLVKNEDLAMEALALYVDKTNGTKSFDYANDFNESNATVERREKREKQKTKRGKGQQLRSIRDVMMTCRRELMEKWIVEASVLNVLPDRA